VGYYFNTDKEFEIKKLDLISSDLTIKSITG
jgi:hypothetical protein